MRRIRLVVATVLLLVGGRVTEAGRLRVDIGPENDRKDILTAGWENWRLAPADSVSKAFGEVTVTLRRVGTVGKGLAADWWKGGIDFGATVPSDGVFVADGDQGGQMEMVIQGLAPGKHTIVTYHNSIWTSPLSRFDLQVDGLPKLKGVTPTTRATHRDDTATACVEFEATTGKEVVFRFVPDGSGKLNNVILNGFEIDRPDPARQALMPSPADGDEHAETPVLAWRAAKSAVAHEVYFGTDPQRLATATPQSPEFQGRREGATFAIENQKLNNFATYYWRVDSIFGDAPQSPVCGEVCRFRMRQLAFPGAEGYGRFAIGGRAGKVFTVTNLDDAGPGSLREAVESNGPRTVVFNVSGLITLRSKLVYRNPYLTIAGQTAPGKGICIRNYTFGGLGARDTVIRYMRLRLGDLAGITMDGMGLASSDSSIIDHCSISWTIDEAFSSRAAKNITLQRCLLSEALNVAGHANYAVGKGHGYAASIGGNVGSFHHNLLAHCAGRNWSLAGGLNQAGRHTGLLDIRNNVVYNWNHRTTDGGAKQVNFVNNYYQPGPASTVFHVLMSEREGVASFGPQDYFASGNVMVGHFGADEPLGGVIAKPRSVPVSSFIKDKPFFEDFVTTQTAAEAYESVLADVGCNLPVLDDHDKRVIEEVRGGSTTFKGSKSGLPGIPDSQADVGGWEDYPVVHRPDGWDTDGDGMPNRWELLKGFDPNNPADGAVDSGDGYTNLEKYLNSIVSEQ